MQKQFKRLPLDPSPTHYNLTYTWVNLETTTEFEGNVEVNLEFGSSFDAADITSITMNSVNLLIVSAKLNGKDAVNISTHSSSQTIELSFLGPTKAGSASLSIEFRGRLNSQLAGFYKSVNNDKQVMGVTQFEATDARRAFPCWDEPARKATFQLKLTVSPTAFVLSNTRVKSKTSSKSTWASGLLREGVTWEFYPTPKMSTYLVAFLVAPDASSFDSLSAHSPNPPFIETVVYVPKGKLKQAEFASMVGVKALDFFSSMFDMPYPLPLLQMVACPDFAAGAMENFGLVTYREARLLVDVSTSFAVKRDVARVVCHELAHMWFGNTCTMEWWTDLWLNEGFARFCEFLAVDHILPELDAWTTFDLDVIGTALRLDALKSSHPIRVDVQHPDEINEIFDAVSYAKGASVLRMLTNFLGGLDAFVAGVRLYLKEFQYKNAVSDDLWRFLEIGASKPSGSIVELMRSWTTQVGYPVIKIEVDESKSVKLSQTRYLTISSPGEDTSNVKWTIPATVLTKEGSEFFQVTPEVDSSRLQELEAQLSLKERDDAWFVLNGKGDLFRVCYTTTQWKRLIKDGFQHLSIRTRLSLVRDAFDLAESGHIEVNIPLELALTLLKDGNERDPYVLVQTISKLHSLVLAYSGETFEQEFNELINTSLNGVLKMLGPWKTVDGFFDAKVDPKKIDELRISTLRCAIDCSSTSDLGRDAFEMLKSHCAGVTPCPNDLRPTIFRMAASYSGEETLNMLLKRYDEVESQEKREIFASFGGLKTENTIKRALSFTLSEKVRSQDVPLCIANIAATRIGGKLLWENFQSNFSWWVSKFSDGNFYGVE